MRCLGRRADGVGHLVDADEADRGRYRWRDFLSHEGDAAHLIRAFDWASTALGPIDCWPQSLKSAVGLLVHSPVPMVLLWGADGYMIYNDAYSVFAGANHPRLIGAKVREGWPEVADFNDNVMRVGLSNGTLHYEDQELILHRRIGKPERVWLNLDYSPVLDEDGKPAGVIAIVIETTQRVLAERRSKVERDRLQQMFQQSPTIMALLSGPDHCIEYANPGFEEVIGHRPIIGRSLAVALPEVAEQGFVALLDQAYRDRLPIAQQAAAYTRPGADRPRYYDFVFQPLLDADGSVTNILISAVDVTDRIAGSAALQESEARFRGVAEAMPGFVWTARADGQLDYTSPRWQEYAGGGADTGLGDSWAAYLHPDDRAPAEAAWASSVAGGAVYEIEFRLRRHDGAYRWWLVRAVPTRDEAGQVQGWVGSAADIDALVAARKVLEQSRGALEQEVARRIAEVKNREAQLRAVFSTSHLLQGLLEPDGTVIDANHAALLAIGVTREEVIGRPIWETPWCTRLPGVAEQVRAAVERVAAGEAISLPVTAKLPSGQRHFEFSMRPVTDAAGNISWLLPEAVDITARVEAEDALRQAQKLDAMGQLTGGVAHDFNNLLTPIIGSLDMLLRRGLPGERERRLVEGGLQAADRAKTLVQRLLAFARRQPLQPSAIDVGALVRGMADLLVSTTGPTIRVTIEVDRRTPLAMADANQIEMAVLNLCVNARDAMPAGGTIAIDVRPRQVADGLAGLAAGDYVELAIADTGTGMDADLVARAIEPFFSTKGIGKGTGLGLSMVHGLASQLGGAMTIDSWPGAGTTVTMMIPAAAENAQPGAGADAGVDVAAAAAATATALVVDDEVLIRMSSADMLADLGFTVLEAGSAEEALDMVRGGARIDVLITDHLMEGMSGSELAEELRRSHPHVPVLLVTGYAGAAGVAADIPRLVKPFRQAQLIEAVTSLLRRPAGNA